MPNEAFCVIYIGFVRLPKHSPNRIALQNVPHPRAGGVGANNVDVVKVKMSTIKRHFHALSLPFGIRQHEIGCVGIDRVTDNLAVDFGSSRLRIGKAFERIQTTAFGDHDAVSVFVKRT